MFRSGKTMLAALTLAVLALFCSCGSQSENKDDPYEGTFTGYCPDFLVQYEGEEKISEYKISEDITAKTDSDRYSVNDDRIVVTLYCSTPNMPIWCFRHPGIEKKNGDEWELLPMSKRIWEAAYYDTGWRGFGRQWKSDDECMTLELDVEKADMYNDWESGQYRVIVFLEGNSAAYAEFEITD